MKKILKIKFYLIISMTLLCYNSTAQHLEWLQSFGAENEDVVTRITLDDERNIYITGRFTNTVTFGTIEGDPITRTSTSDSKDAFFAKYSPAGELRFVRVISSVQDDNGEDIKVDRAGNIYVSGVYREELSFETSKEQLPFIKNNEIFLVKYDPRGNYLFSCRVAGIGTNRIPRLDVDDSENIYLTGEFDVQTILFSADGSESKKLEAKGKRDVFLAKFDKTGQLVLQNRIGGSENDSPRELLLSSQNVIYLTGTTRSENFDPDSTTTADKILSTFGNNDVFLAKYTDDLEYIDAKNMGGENNEFPNGMYLDNDDNVYLAGRTDKEADFDPDEDAQKIIGTNEFNIFFAKYTSDLKFILAESFGGGDSDKANDVVADTDGNIYLVGEFTSAEIILDPQNIVRFKNNGNEDGFFAKYSPDGQQLLFSRQIGAEGSDRVKDITIDALDNFYITGDFQSTIRLENTGLKSRGDDDFFIAKYTPGLSEIRPVASVAEPTHLHAADLDGDGLLDIISANGTGDNSSSVTWHKNNGQGSFGEPQVVGDNFQQAKAVYGIDINNDGQRDIVAAIFEGDRIVWYENKNGSFEKNVPSAIPIYDGDDENSFPLAIFPADLDNDGDLDVLAAHNNQGGKITWHENRLSEESNDFNTVTIDEQTPNAQSVFAIDINGDNFLDVLAAHKQEGKISLYMNQPANNEASRTLADPRQFTMQQEINLENAEFVTAANLDADSQVEIIALSNTNIQIFNVKEGQIDPTPIQTIGGLIDAQALSTADLDGDGDLDVVSSSEGDNLIAWYENTNGTLGSRQVITNSADGTRIVLTSDLDSDGRSDILWASLGNNEIAWAKNQLFTPVNPSITTFNPASTSPGNTFTIFGANFSDAAKVFFENSGSSVEAPSVTPDNSGGIEKLIVTIPGSLSIGSYKIKITDGGKTVVSIDDLMIPTLPIPEITELSPTSGPVGIDLTINGKNFGADASKVQVKFGTAATYAVSAEELKSSNEIGITVPNIPEGSHPVSVVVGSLESNKDNAFTVTPPGTPVISSLSTNSAPAGVNITITGDLFGTDKSLVKVFFDETEIAAADFTLNSEKEIGVKVPDITPGPYDIKVTVDGKSSNEIAFTIANPNTNTPSLSTIDPASITVGNTPTVTITGANFGNNAGDITVSFKDTDNVATDVTTGINVNGGTEITFTAPALSAKAYTVSVTVNGTVSDNTLNFSVQPDTGGGNDPVISTIPSYGNVDAQIVITGSNFGTDASAVAVTFKDNGTSATGNIVSITNNEIVVEVPDNLPESNYSILVDANGKQATSAKQLVIDNTPPAISADNISVFDYFAPGNTKELTATASDTRSGIFEVNLVYSGIRDDNTNTQTAPFNDNGDNTYSIDLQNLTTTDELGIAYHVIATDSAGNASRFPETSTHFLHKDLQSMSIAATKASDPDTPTANDYNLVAVPLDGITRDEVFNSLGAFGGSKDANWWLFEHDAESGYSQVSSPSASLDPRKGYMLIFRNAATIQPQGRVLPAAPSQPVSITLAPGANLIGNPFPFDVDWSTVLNDDANKDVPGLASLGPLRSFNRGNWPESSQLTRFKGALVFNAHSDPVTIEIPHKKNTGGRFAKEEKNKKLTPLDAPAWEVPLEISTGERYVSGGIGMQPDAAESYDPSDDFTVPRFIDYLEMNFHHPEFFLSKFAKDIAPTKGAYNWEFEVASNLASPEVTIDWENHYFGNNRQALMLLDLHNHHIVNMREATSYTFSVVEGTRKFKIFFGDEDEVWENMLPERITVQEAYPNPMQHQFTVPVSLPRSGKQYTLTVEIYNITGQLVKRVQQKHLPAGYHRLEWDRTNTDGEQVKRGLYFYKLQVDDYSYEGRVIAW